MNARAWLSDKYFQHKSIFQGCKMKLNVHMLLIADNWKPIFTFSFGWHFIQIWNVNSMIKRLICFELWHGHVHGHILYTKFVWTKFYSALTWKSFQMKRKTHTHTALSCRSEIQKRKIQMYSDFSENISISFADRLSSVYIFDVYVRMEHSYWTTTHFTQITIQSKWLQ